MDLQTDTMEKSVLELTPYEYENFIHNRLIDM
jgi:hypothetical protein